MATITRATLAKKIRELFGDEKSYGQWSHGGQNLLSDSEYRHIAYNKAWEEVLPAYGWPGGYAIVYYLPSGEAMCSECARAYLEQNKDLYADMGESFTLYSDSTDGYEGNDSADHLYCDDCHALICRAWLRDEGHADDADLPAELLAQLRAEDAA